MSSKNILIYPLNIHEMVDSSYISLLGLYNLLKSHGYNASILDALSYVEITTHHYLPKREREGF